jgi:hypothetical protein
MAMYLMENDNVSHLWKMALMISLFNLMHESNRMICDDHLIVQVSTKVQMRSRMEVAPR